MKKKSSTLSDEDFLFGFVHDFLSDELPGTEKTRFEKLIGRESSKSFLEQQKEAFGKLQLSFQGYYLTEDQRVQLHEIVEDPNLRKTREAEKITQIYDATAVVDGVPQTANLFTGGLSSSLVYWNRMGDS